MANPNSRASLKVSLDDASVDGLLPRKHQTITLPAGPDWISEPRGQTPSHRLLSAALLMSSSALRNFLTTSTKQMDSIVTESALRRSWIGV